MKQAFSTAWRASTQPRKQRKYAYNAPRHLRGRLLAVHLSKELRTKYGVRALRVRKGDKVRILRGTHKGKEGPVEHVDTRNCRIHIAKVEHARREGGVARYPIRPSNCLLIDVANDKRRFPVKA
jgi:large subunit ribosomal protein L24